MGNGVTVTGAQGLLKWSYHEAASLGAWTVTTVEGKRTLSASIVQSNASRVSQRPLVFVVPHATGAWRWPIVGELQMSGASLTATLGPREV